MKCIFQSPLTHRKIAIISGDVVLRHSGRMFTSLMQSLLCTTVVGYREFCPSTPILIAKTGFDRPHASTIRCASLSSSIHFPLWLAPSIDFWGSSNKTPHANKQVTLKDKSTAPTLCNVLKFGKGKREGGSVFEMQSWAECQFTSKTAIKRHWAMFHSAFTQRL